MKALHSSKLLTIALFSVPLLFSPSAISASLERATDISSFIYGQRGLGINMDGSVATDFGHITDDPSINPDGGLQQYTSRTIQVFEDVNQYVTLGATHGLSISPMDASRQTYLIDMSAYMNAGGLFANHDVSVVIGNNALSGSAYADAGLNQTFRILAGAGENAGDPVSVKVRFDASTSNFGSVGTGSAWLSSQFPGPFRVVLNDTQKWELPSNHFDTPGFNNVVDLTFDAAIGDTVGIGYMAGFDAFGPAVFANYAMSRTFVMGERLEEGRGIHLMGSVSVIPVPEPETYALMLAGLGLVGWAARRRKGKLL